MSCSICKERLERKCNRLQCHDCEEWFHKACVTLDLGIIEKLKEGKTVWSCEDCCADEETVKTQTTTAPGRNTGGVSLEDIMAKLNCIEDKHKRLLQKFENQLKINCELNNEIKFLKDEVQNLKKMRAMDIGTVTSEVNERIHKSRNIIITNLPESNDTNLSLRIKHDTELVASLLNHADISSHEIVKNVRLGKKGNKDRLTRVVLSSREVALKVLKKKRTIIDSSRQKISLFADQTDLQRSQYNDTRRELKRRLESGEKDLVIKFARGVPEIVQATQNDDRGTQEN